MEHRLDLAAIRTRADTCDRAGDNADIEALLDAINSMLALPTPMPSDKSEEWCSGWDAGWGAFRREARKLFGVEE